MTDLLQATSLAKKFGDHEVIKDVSFSVPRGTVTAIVGPSGSGKTTLLRGLNALERPDSGIVQIADVSVDFAKIRASRRGRLGSADRALLRRYQAHSGMVFQGHNLFPHRTALQNVTEGPIVVQRVPAAEATENARALLAKVGLADHADKFPYQLSGGQQQRVGIARALALEPDLLLFDEPTSALDPELVGEVLDVIRQLAKEGRTMVLVTHEIRFARDVADEVLFIDGGLVVERGRPRDVLDHPKHERTQAFLRRLLEV
ncbi:ABC transporter ATP-binding protein [Flexivirga endophytica]|uniref:ABC transporter ATP-binding protein n=1 Tax=Flexivirga endophytica TaxID=1849103 RepID=A0A916SZY6_9MICO|nr:amino acid ABC transporter ATP-binding protein [Flexivirga endophytica]GGB25332.1 ABC transporter ATP-binding protein [Flexivirga endophytica]GHB53891.1 ABC transporter ATP-binding protein [Flexivirga endophytica]